MEFKYKSNIKKAFRSTTVEYITLIIVLFLIFLIIKYSDETIGVKFKSIQEGNIVSIIASLFVIAIFMERSIEGLLIPVREPDRQKILSDIEIEEDEINDKLKEQTRINEQIKKNEDNTPRTKKLDKELLLYYDKIDELRGEMSSLRKDILELQYGLATYESKTKKIAMRITFFFGIAISIVGIRVLAGLLEVEKTTFTGNFDLLGVIISQENLFDFVDIVLTGGVIAGGSAAIDKMGSRISEYLKPKKESQ